MDRCFAGEIKLTLATSVYSNARDVACLQFLPELYYSTSCKVQQLGRPGQKFN